MVTRETWGKVMAEFPSDLGKVRGSILRYMGEQAPPCHPPPLPPKLRSAPPSSVGRKAPGLSAAVSEASRLAEETFLPLRPGSPALLQEKTAFFSAVPVPTIAIAYSTSAAPTKVSPEFARLAREMAETRTGEETGIQWQCLKWRGFREHTFRV